MSKTNGKASAPRRRPGVTSEILDRQPPCNIEAEHCVLGSILIHPDVCDDIAGILRPEDFYDDANSLLYWHFLRLHDAGKTIDITLLVDELQRAGDYEKIGGPTHLARVTNSVPNAAHAVYYARIVKEKAELRALIFAQTAGLRDAYDGNASPDELRRRLFEQIERVDDRGNEPLQMSEVVDLALDRVERRRRGEHMGVEIGLTGFDQTLAGLHGGELIVLAARPAMGKTALAVQIATHQAQKGNSVLFASLEMSAAELTIRMLCSQAAVDHRLVRTGEIEDIDLQMLNETADRMRDMQLAIIDKSSMTVSDLRTAARRLRRRIGLSLVVVDYLTRLTPRDTRVKRYEQVGQLTSELKRMARELDAPVLVLAQLNREVENAKDNRPRLSHLRDSGDVEQDADVVLLLNRPEVFRPHDADLRGKAELIVAKNRNGPEASFHLEWLPHTTEFRTPLPRNYDPQARLTEDF